MKFSLLYEVQGQITEDGVDEVALYKETLEQCVFADEMGFDYIWLVEHHFLPGFSYCPSPSVFLAALSQLTKRIRLGYGVAILPFHHPLEIAEAAATVDKLSGGRVDLGTGRSSAFEQAGMGVDPRDSRDMWEESITMIPKIWQSDEFSWEGRFWNMPPRRVMAKPFQKPHPPLWVACLQPTTFALAAEKGLGVLSSASYAPSVVGDHIKAYHENIRNANPVGSFVNAQWANNVFALCGRDNRAAREMCLESLKTFYAPEKPYVKGRAGVYEELLAAWGVGVPDHLKAEFSRWLRDSSEEQKAAATAAGLDVDSGVGAARAAVTELDADTLCENGVLIAGDPESCIKAINLYEEVGADQLIMITQTETVPHEKAMESIELFGKKVFPTIREAEQEKAGSKT